MGGGTVQAVYRDFQPLHWPKRPKADALLPLPQNEPNREITSRCSTSVRS